MNWRGLCRHVTRFRHDERGNIAMLFAVFIGVAVTCGALAVDEGGLYLQRRRMQAAVDLAAITAAMGPTDAFARAKLALTDAGLVSSTETDAVLRSGAGPQTLDVETGAYTPDPALGPTARFAAGAGAPNAVHVRFSAPGQLYFAQSWSHRPVIDATATASATPEVSFSVGSTLLELDDGLANALLNNLLGTNVSLDAVSYRGLLAADIDLFDFLDALAQQLGISAGTYADVLAAHADKGQIAQAIADTLDGADAAMTQLLAQDLLHQGTVPLSRLLGLGEAAGLDIGTGSRSGYDAHLSALQMLLAAVTVSDGTHQATLALNANVPGLTGLSLSVAVGEPAQHATWFALGPAGTVARTAQIRLRLVATLSAGLALLNATVHVPLFLDVAYAEAEVATAACPELGASTGSATVNAQPGIASLALGDVGDTAFVDFSQLPNLVPTTLISVPLLQVTGSGVATTGAIAPSPLRFTVDDITNGVVRRATTTTPVQSLAATLLPSLTLNVRALGLGLSLSAVSHALGLLLTPLAPTLDSVIATTLASLGVNLGAADVRVYGVTCSHAVLVG